LPNGFNPGMNARGEVLMALLNTFHYPLTTPFSSW